MFAYVQSLFAVKLVIIYEYTVLVGDNYNRYITILLYSTVRREKTSYISIFLCGYNFIYNIIFMSDRQYITNIIGLIFQVSKYLTVYILP